MCWRAGSARPLPPADLSSAAPRSRVWRSAPAPRPTTSRRCAAAGSAVPILGLNPAPGQVDILLATELLEAARMVHAGFVTPARTLVIAADRRVYATDEKVAMADGRASEDQLRGALKRFSRRLVLADLAAAAADNRSPLNVVMLGVLGGTARPCRSRRRRFAPPSAPKARRLKRTCVVSRRGCSWRNGWWLLPLPVYGERVGVRGNHERPRKLLPLTLTLSPRKSGERGQAFPPKPASCCAKALRASPTTKAKLMRAVPCARQAYCRSARARTGNSCASLRATSPYA